MIICHRRLILCVTALGFLTVGVSAQSQTAGEPIITDRPDITESSAVVGKGRFQMETSAQWEQVKNGSKVNVFFTPTLLRYGVIDKLELRFESGAFSHLRVSQSPLDPLTDSGYSPFALGIKYHFADAVDGTLIPSVGLLVHFGVPSGSGVFSTDDGSLDAAVAADWDLSPVWSLGANVGWSIEGDDFDNLDSSAFVSAAVGYGLTESLGLFAELAFAGLGQEDSGIFDTGVTYLLNPNAQFDVAVGAGITEDSVPDVFVTTGFSFRVAVLPSPSAP